MEIFTFEKDLITNFIKNTLKTLKKFKEPLNYIINCLIKNGNSVTIDSLDGKINLNKIKEYKGKNYHWSTIIYKNHTLLIRRYDSHLTIYTKISVQKDGWKRPRFEYGAFILNTDSEKFGKKYDKLNELYYSKPFTDLNSIIKPLINLLIDESYGVRWIPNSAAITIPKYSEIKLIFSDDIINSVDWFIFCMEEIEGFYLNMFAENTMFNKLKEYINKEGEELNSEYTINKVELELKNSDYHEVGMKLIDNKNKITFVDIYRLTKWYLNDVFKEGIYSYNGEIYIEGGELKIGGVVASKSLDDTYTTILQESHSKKNFIPLVKLNY